MAYRKFLLVLLLLGCVPAFGGYAQLSPPANVSRVAGQMMVKAAANDASFAAGAGIRSAAGVINVGGRSVSMPVAYRYAANASQVAARYAFGNPALFLGVLAGTAAAAYFLDPNTLIRLVGDKWAKKTEEFSCSPFVGTPPEHSSVFGAVGWAESWSCYASGSAMMWGWSVSGPTGQHWKEHIQPAVAQENPAYQFYTEEQFVADFAGRPLTAGVPQALGIPLPVESPIIDPSPGDDPVSQPLRVPQGEPQPVPNSNPQTWGSPVVDITPSPTVNDPWRVDVEPKTIVANSPNPLPESEPVPSENPPGQTEDPVTPDLCEKNPDILACQKLDTPDSPDLETVNKEVGITPLSGWGAENSACPAPRHLVGMNADYSFQPVCDFMSGLRPVIVAVAWLAAAFILLGFKQGE